MGSTIRSHGCRSRPASLHGRSLIPLTLAVALLAMLTEHGHAAPTALEQQCFEAVQGKVAYNQQGNRVWNDANVRALCQGTTSPAATIACFQSEIRTHNSWQRGLQACRPAPEAGPAAAGPPPASSAASASGATGRTVTLVDVGQAGRKLAEYRQTGPREWVETGVNGTQFRFEEMQRDDWSVYLVDRSRGVSIQIDLHTRRVMYSDASSPRRPVYDVLAAVAPPPGGGGGGPVDPSFMIVRCGPVRDEPDAVSKCTAACRRYQGFSGRWAVAVEPDLAVCQCRARPLANIAAHEILTDVIRTGEEAARACPRACQWYGGGDGTWGKLDEQSSICGCAERVRP